MASDTVRDAVRLMAAPGDGIAPAAVADLVRRRLADDPVGRAALTALDDAPDDPGTVRRLEGTIRALGDRDPAFLAALTRVVHRATAAPADPPALPRTSPRPAPTTRRHPSRPALR
ncbi:hypothetical protein [Streptomyces sp. RFCAC02]|uniref:hypothetical protein n=1 Tax=Streptomyces sp. RFCAC02 TaxID=2499143 RepID=UPI001021BADC|nr:hypothetical protein [Streptomyces sp. RFCAC02]